ncbi:MAG: acyl-ACP--UDP-N-acetylglucosamine O-acyltransferase [Planctomycetota bacterium]|nr:acyl-ACP--UDP-N-acetylglucosamine O-acyltransferase [Planctomycetota bacterium]
MPAESTIDSNQNASRISPWARVAPTCQIDPTAEVGPGCVLEGDVRLARGVKLIGNVYLQGPVEIGPDTVVYPFACIGFPGQDFKFKPGMETLGVRIGSGCILREHVTIHAATKPEGPTTIGDRVFMMVGSHAGHDVTIGNDAILVNGASIGGHGVVGERATLGGGVMVHQFTRVGRFAFLSGGSAFSDDVPPYCTGWGRNTMIGLNLVGMRRSGVSRENVTLARRAYREAFRAGLPRKEALGVLEQIGRECPPVAEMARFVASGKRPLSKHLRSRSSSGEPPEEGAG